MAADDRSRAYDEQELHVGNQGPHNFAEVNPGFHVEQNAEDAPSSGTALLSAIGARSARLFAAYVR